MTNAAALSLIKSFEGLSLVPYKCAAGVPTVGWGSTRGVTLDMPPITAEEAERRLGEDVAVAEAVVDAHVKAPLNANQRAALTSFVFNLGPGKPGYKDGFVWLKSGRHSTLLTLLNDGQYAAASQQFPLWATAGGVRLRGLVRRREAERALFMKPVA